jgi:fibronectin type 3 domain-containing protein
MISVANGLTTYTVTNLTIGTTYYFVVTALDANGVESTYTNPVSKAIS